MRGLAILSLFVAATAMFVNGYVVNEQRKEIDAYIEHNRVHVHDITGLTKDMISMTYAIGIRGVLTDHRKQLLKHETRNAISVTEFGKNNDNRVLNELNLQLRLEDNGFIVSHIYVKGKEIVCDENGCRYENG